MSKKQPKQYDIEIPEFRYRRRWNLSRDGSLWIVDCDAGIVRDVVVAQHLSHALQRFPARLAVGAPQFWGVPNIIGRVLFGIDLQLAQEIRGSQGWKGSDGDLLNLIKPYALTLAQNLPIREAIDFVHSAISMTCKGLKFSQLPPMCGGPVEVAVITSDRRFRWVSHKSMREAIP